MSEGGETIRGGGAADWSEVEKLASQAPDMDQEQDQEQEEVVSEEKESRGFFALTDEERMARLDEMRRKDVFEDVDLENVRFIVGEVLEKVDGEKLLDLQEKIEEDFETGILAAVEYYADVIGLKEVPILQERKLDGKALADCRADESGNRDVISYDREKIKSVDGELLLFLGHECWHSFQHQKIRAYYSGEGKVDWRTVLYAYNNQNYISSDDDYEAYRNQLTEAEAFAFEDGLRAKMRKARTNRFVKSHPEIYGEENLEGIEREIGAVFQGFDVNEFLEKVGVESVNEFFEKVVKGQVDEGFTQRYVETLADLAGLKDELKVKFTDLETMFNSYLEALDIKARSTGGTPMVAAFGREINIHEGMKGDSDLFLRSLPKKVWEYRQREMILGNPGSERAKLYSENLANYAIAAYDPKVAESQLVQREQTKFAETLMGILNEQVTEEELRKLPLPKRVMGRLELRRKGGMRLSKKYKVKRDW